MRASMLFAAAISLFAIAPACTTLKADEAPLIDCGEKSIAAQTPALTSTVGAVLASQSPNWNADLEAAITAGGDAAVCALEVVTASLEKSAAATGSSPVALARAYAFKLTHAHKFVLPPAPLPPAPLPVPKAADTLTVKTSGVAGGGGLLGLLALLGLAIFGIATAPTSTITPTPGAQTSEFSLAKMAMVVGTVATIGFGVLSQMQGVIPGGSKEAGYIAAGLAVCGMVLKVVSLFGYTSSRTDQKVAGIQATAQVEAAKVQGAASASPTAAAAALS